MVTALRVRVVDTSWYVRNVVTRLPFRYGAATLTRVPILHLRARVEAGDGRRTEGWSADCLPPGWFDKRPGRCFRDDIESLRWSAETAVAAVGGQPGTAFELWRLAHGATVTSGMERDETGLTCGFGPALLERALVDAVGKLGGTPVHETFRNGSLGTDLTSLHPALAGCRPEQLLPTAPMESLAVRHTVGLSDPLTQLDLASLAVPEDGLPRTLEEYIEQRGLRYFKVKVAGWDDVARVRATAELLDRAISGRYVVTLDGNEQFESVDALGAFLEALWSDPVLQRFCRSIEYVEQPLARAFALAPGRTVGLPALSARVPITIDESDDALDSFARAAELGYRGVSAKCCKGVTKALANLGLAQVFTRRWGRRYFLTGEDLMNVPVVPLQQDLAAMAMLGIAHVELNGHHYVRGLDHLSGREIDDCLEAHASLYEPLPVHSGQLRICDGLLDLRSLAVPGFGVAHAPDWSRLTRGEQWSFEDLGLDE